VESSIITAMMQRDQTLKIAWGMAAEPTPPAAVVPISNIPPAETVAAAPTYVNPPVVVQPVVQSQPVYVDNNYFNDSLSPYGTWVEIDGYGRCWRPAIVATRPSWRPYSDGGRWVHTDAGWYWMSDYSWGSVAFHYGRWFNHARWGWCWWPDRVWAPSWVTWRYDNDHCGWAPLPPNSVYTPGVGFSYFGRSVGANFDFHLGVGSFLFVPWNRFCDPYPYRHCLTQPRSVAIYNRTTIVNDYDGGRGRSVLNRGIPAERVREHARTEVRTVRIRSEAPRGVNPRAERFEGNGQTLVVHRPEAVAGQNPRGEAGRGQPAARGGADLVRTNPERIVTPRPARSESPAPLPVGRDNNTASRGGAAPAVRSINSGVAQPTSVTPTPVTRPTPIFSKPVVVETRPQTPNRPTQTTPSVQTIPRGENRSSQTRGRDYSVWSTPTQRSEPSAPAAPSFNNSPARNSSVVRSAPQITAEPASPVVRPVAPSRSEIMSGRSQSFERSGRAEVRSAAPSVSVPAPAPTISAPVRSYTPPAAPTPTPSPSRVESRPAAPARSEATDSNRGRR